MPTQSLPRSRRTAKAGPDASTSPAPAAPQFQPVRTQRTFEVVCDQIRERIARGDLKQGDRLPGEKDMAEQFGVSRSAVREALRTLESAGLVQVTTGIHGGFFIHSGNPSGMAQTVQDMLSLKQLSIAHVTEARIELMAVAIRLACERATAEELDEIEADIEHHETLFQQGGGSRNTQSVIRFYQLIAKATHNEVLVMMVDALSEIIRKLLLQVDPRPREDIMTVRRKVLAHMRARNAQAACNAMTQHLRLVNDYLESENAKRLQAATRRARTR